MSAQPAPVDGLFSHTRTGPLADRMRPRRLDEVVGQAALLGPGGLLRRLLKAGRLPSLVFWGPPGTGKTTLARLLAEHLDARLHTLSAVLSGVAELRKELAEARRRLDQLGHPTLLFVDEIHRWSKSQQDALLPAVESGAVTLVGATTENPSFELNAALLSRLRVLRLEPLSPEEVKTILERALEDRERGLGALSIRISSDDLTLLAESSEGDARKALTVLEVAVQEAKASSSASNGLHLGRAALENALQSKILLYDKAGDGHYGVISAFIKSMRGSDPDAAVYYLVRMLESGEQPRFLLRRMVIFASEDVGNADPRALAVATDALRAFEFVGLPEGVLPMVQCATYLALAPKSNAVLEAYGAARKLVRATGSPPVPKHLLNAPDPLSRQLGHGRGYRYPHAQGGIVPGETHLPEALGNATLYEPRDAGFERELRQRVDEVRRLRTDEPAPDAPPEANPKDVK